MVEAYGLNGCTVPGSSRVHALGAVVLLAAALVMSAAPALATTYEVGDGKPYTSIGAVPWESLNAGDTVLIYYRATAYKEKFVLGRVGTVSQPITVRGVAGGGGELPVIDGQSATTRQQLETGSEARGIITMQQWTTAPPACRQVAEAGATLPPDGARAILPVRLATPSPGSSSVAWPSAQPIGTAKAATTAAVGRMRIVFTLQGRWS